MTGMLRLRTSPRRPVPRWCWPSTALPTGGRSTPVNAWWGSFDLAVNLFSGEPADPPSEDFIMRNAMDAQEVAVGWWPGNPKYGKAAFYAYAYPAPAAFGGGRLSPGAARWEQGLGEYVLHWDDIVASPDPHSSALEFRALGLSTLVRGMWLGSGAARQHAGEAAADHMSPRMRKSPPAPTTSSPDFAPAQCPVTARGPKNKSTPFRVGSTPANRDEERGPDEQCPRKPQETSCTDGSGGHVDDLSQRTGLAGTG
jgi:hypothetical protein